MKLVSLLPLLLLVGCTTVPVATKFPEVPKELTEKCPTLKTIDKEEEVSIIDITKSVTLNYTSYYECGIKVESWIEWYNDQKKIFDKAVK